MPDLKPPIATSATRAASPCSARCVALLAALMLVAPAAWPQGTPTHPAVLAQKTRLLEQLLGSSRAREVEAGGDAEARQTLQRARELLVEASSGGAADLEQRLNEALRLASAALRTRGAQPIAADAQAQRNAELQQQVLEYRRAIDSAAKARGGAAPPALVAIDRRLESARDLTTHARHDDAARELTQAYRTAVESLSALRAGETVTIDLKFDTPADEYAYERRRFQGHELLVQMVLDERQPAAGVRATIERLAGEARLLQGQAAERATQGDHRAGIQALEQATRLLVRALQAAGMPVF